MPLPTGLSTDQLTEITFLDGLNVDGTVGAKSLSVWKGDIPATYTGEGAAFKWGGGASGTASGTIDYYFDPGSNWTANEINVWNAALAYWSSIAGITYTLTADTTPADALGLFRFNSTTPPPNADDGAYASTNYTKGTIGDAALPAVADSHISIETGNTGDYFNFNDTFANLFAGTAGGSGIATVIHELGHTLGLGHSGPYNANVNSATQQLGPYDSFLYSVMAYIGPETKTSKYYAQYPVSGTAWGTVNGIAREPTTAQMLDIPAIQQLYGVSQTATFAGGQTFGFNCNIAASVKPFFDFTINTTPIVTLWDRGLGNTLDLSGYDTACTVDLIPGTFSSFAGLTNNMAIAYGTQINTAIGGAADDIFYDNGFGDIIDGRAGANTAVLTLAKAAYTFARITPTTVTATASGITSTFTNIDTLQFSDGSSLAAADVPCFTRGTRIHTPHGDTAVEHLAIGMHVLTAAGAARPIKWLGRRAYTGPALAACPDRQPIRIAQGAIAEGIPARDLYVSSRHALFIDDVLIPAEALVNGASIIRCTSWTEVEYIHIELHGHDILLAENCPAESFVDDNSRGLFQNAAEFAALYPSDTAPGAFCAQLIECGPAFEAIRARLDTSAGLAPTTPEPLQGALDIATTDLVAGWARVPSNEPVRLEILVDGNVVAHTRAIVPRPDVRDAGFGNGRSGFHVTGLRLDPSKRHSLTIRRSTDSAVLGATTIPEAAAA